jgi:hypothetical protein
MPVVSPPAYIAIVSPAVASSSDAHVAKDIPLACCARLPSISASGAALFVAGCSFATLFDVAFVAADCLFCFLDAYLSR